MNESMKITSSSRIFNIIYHSYLLLFGNRELPNFDNLWFSDDIKGDRSHLIF